MEKSHLFLPGQYFKVTASNYHSSFKLIDLGLDKYQDEKKMKKSKSFDNFFGQKSPKSGSSNHQFSTNSATSVVMALIKFYEKSKAKPENDNQESVANKRDTVSKLDQVSNRKNKINFGKMVSEGTHAIKTDDAQGKREVNGPGQEANHSPQNDQSVADNLIKRKGSKLKNKVSLKNNSMDEFLLLVKKTKKKYKDMLEKDHELKQNWLDSKTNFENFVEPVKENRMQKLNNTEV